MCIINQYGDGKRAGALQYASPNHDGIHDSWFFYIKYMKVF